MGTIFNNNERNENQNQNINNNDNENLIKLKGTYVWHNSGLRYAIKDGIQYILLCTFSFVRPTPNPKSFTVLHTSNQLPCTWNPILETELVEIVEWSDNFSGKYFNYLHK